MTTEAALFRLMSWLSPSYPVGSYAYSHGLEAAVDEGLVTTAAQAQEWIADILLSGGGFIDLVALSESWDAAQDPEQLAAIHELAHARQATRELRLESTGQGEAFVATAARAWPCEALASLRQAVNGSILYPVAVGVLARGHGIAKSAILTAYGHAFAANLVSAAVRLVPLGQTDGQLMTAALESVVAQAAQRALECPLDEAATSTFMADIHSMQHETQYTRLFRS